MSKLLTMSSEKAIWAILTLLTAGAMLAVQISSSGCLFASFEQPKIPKSLIK
jgi:cyclic lactone autoinducer peptide